MYATDFPDMTSPTRTGVIMPDPAESSRRSNLSVKARSSLSVSTRSMARGNPGVKTALGEIYRNVSATETISRTLVGGKRKQIQTEQDGPERRRKMVRYSDENGVKASESSTSASSIPITPPGKLSATPITPVRSIQPTSAPTPAREILRAGFQRNVAEEKLDEGGEGDETTDSKFVLKPPTPPRMKPRPRLPDHSSSMVSEDVPMTPGKRPRSPSGEPPASSKRSALDDVRSGEPCQHPEALLGSPPQPSTSAALPSTSTSTLSICSEYSSLLSPRRALGSISRFGTTPKKGLALFPPPPPSSTLTRMTPTVPVPFTFSTPRTKSSASQSASHDLSADGRSMAMDTSTSRDSDTSSAVDSEKGARAIKPLPKASTMGPPSRLPVKAAKAPPAKVAGTSAAAASTSATTTKAKPRPQLGVAERRPTRRVASGSSSAKSLTVLDESGDTKKSDVPVRRKPSYPSSLGSGPLAKPRSRLVSGPIQPPRSFSSSTAAPPPQSVMDVDHKVQATPRSVSDPVGRPRASLTLSTRRDGFGDDTFQSLAGLSDALAKLKMKRDDSAIKAGPSIASRPKAPNVLADVSALNANANANIAQPVPSSSRLSSVHRPRSSIAGADVSTMEDGDRSMAVLMNTSTGSGKALRGVVAFVDVKTEDGGCAGDIWSDMLRGLGAKVNVRLTTAVTHIIYKSGLPTTLNWYRRQEQEERPYLVGVGWLLKSKKAGERLDEAEFTVDIAVEDIFQKRRKSMEPKALAAANQGVPLGLSGVSGLSLATRKSLQYAPKIGSPLKKGYTRDAFDD